MSKELVKELNLKVGDIYKNFKTLKTYRVVEIKEEEGKVKLEGIETRNLTTTLKALSTNYYLESKEEEVENKKTLVEEALEEANLSSNLGKIGESIEEEVKEEEVKEEVEEGLDLEYSLLIDRLIEDYPSLSKDLIEEEVIKLVPNSNLEEEVKKVLDSYLNIEDPIEETKDPIEDNKEDLEAYIENNKREIILGKEVLVLKKDFSTLKGKIVSIGDFTFKLLVDNKEEIIFFKDLIGTYSKDIDFNKLSSYLTSIKNIKPSSLESKVKKPNKDINTKKVTKKDKEEGIITLREIVEEIVREKLLILDLEYNPNNTFKNIRKKIRKRGELTKSLRLEGYTYSFRIENKNLIKEELLKILA